MNVMIIVIITKLICKYHFSKHTSTGRRTKNQFYLFLSEMSVTGCFPSNIVHISVTQHPCGKSPCTSIFTKKKKTNRNTLMRSMFDYQVIYLWKQDKRNKNKSINCSIFYTNLQAT